MKKCKPQSEKIQKNCKSCKCKCGAKSPRKSKCNSNQDRTSKKIKTLSETENCPQEDECEIYYPPPMPMETEYENLCQPVCDVPNIFNFPPPTYSTMYQEFPQYNICSSNREMVFSVQVEQEQPFCEQVVFQKSESSIYLTCNEDEEEHGEEEEDYEEEEDEKHISKSKKSRKHKAKKSFKGDSYVCEKKENICCQMQPCNYRQQSANIPCRCKEQSVRIPCRCNERLEKIPCRCKEQSVRFSCECPQQPQPPIETYRMQEEMKREPVSITQPIPPVVKPKLPKKKSEWVFWKRVICKDGKEKFLKTSQCPVPKSILRVDRSANQYNYAHEDVELIEKKRYENLANENIEGYEQYEQSGSISKSDKRDEEIQKTDTKKRNSKDVDKNKSERAGSLSKGNKKDEDIQKTNKNKRNSKDVEKNMRESMTHEQSDENKTENHNRRRRQRDVPNPYRIVPCQCAGPIKRNTCKCRKLENETAN